MVEDGRYEQYPWGKIAFNKLMNSLRQDFFVEKQLYYLGGMTHVLNVWIYECCSEVDKSIACRIDSVNSTLPSTSFRQQTKVDQKAKMTVGSLPLDDFDDCTNPPPLELLTKSKAKSDTSLAPHFKKKTDAEQKELVTGQEKIKAHTSIKEVNESPSETSNLNVDQTLHEPYLMDFGKQTPPEKINVFGRTNHEKVLLNVDVNAIESLVKTYNDDGNVVSTGDHKRDEKPSNESSLQVNFADLTIPRETIEVQNVHKESVTEVKNAAFQNLIDNRIAEISSPVIAIQSDDLLQQGNLPDLILLTDNIEVQNELQESMDNIIAGISTLGVAMAVNSNDLSEKVNFPDPFLHTDNVEVSNKPQESTNEISTNAFQESIDNIIAEISTPVVAMKRKSISPKETNDSECQIYDSRFPSDLSEVDMAGDSIKRSCVVVSNEESLINIIKGFNIPAVLPWHIVNDVYAPIPSSNIDAEYLRKRYATLLWNYEVKKAKKVYSSDHDDPPRPRPFYVPPTDESNIVAIE
ncbi:hypothetical protein FXO38_00622 [Capsicum annuum]|nr:hypothetical protein FXO38_00622 [Capsicum annuum]